MKRKVKRYNEGELVDSFSEYQGFGQMGPRTIQEDINAAAEEEKRKPQVRESIGLAEFEEPGTAGFSRTAIRQPVVRPSKPTVKPVATKPAVAKMAEKPMGRTAMGKTADMEMQALARADLERRKSLDKPLERVNPEENLMGGPALRGLKALGTGLATKLAPKASRPRVEPTIPQEPAKALGMSPRKGEVATSGRDLVRQRNTMEQLEAPRKRLPFEKNMGEARLETVANKRRQITGNRRSDDVIEMGMKKGGKVGSASRRADGIAMRGKTRGKYI